MRTVLLALGRVLVARLVLELLLVVGVERRADGQTYLLGKPVVIKVQRSA